MRKGARGWCGRVSSVLFPDLGISPVAKMFESLETRRQDTHVICLCLRPHAGKKGGASEI